MLAGTASAQFSGGISSVLPPPGQEQQANTGVTVSATASTQAFDVGTAFYIAFDASFSDHKHAYYRNPATMGLPMTAQLTAPAGFKIEGPFWQAPQKAGDLYVFYGYDGAATVVWRITPEPDAPAKATFTIDGSVQLCDDMGCQPPTDVSATVELPKGTPTPAPDWANQEKNVEILGDTPLPVTITQDANSVTIRFPYEGDISRAYFFSNGNEIAPHLDQKLSRDGGQYALVLPRNDNSDTMYPVADEATLGHPLTKLSGILTFDGKWVTIDTPIGTSSPTPSANTSAGAPTPGSATGPGTPSSTPSIPEASDSSPATSTAATTTPEAIRMFHQVLARSGAPDGLLVTMGSLFLGGLILNLMPCVFPVIGLKIMSFVQLGGGKRSKIIAHSFIFVLGILVSFWILTLLLVAFSNLETLSQAPWRDWAGIILHDTGSSSRSWAAWMTNPWAVYIILLLLITLGLSMYGVFEIGVSATSAGQELQNKGGLTGSFFQGLFVTIVATPCSAPFLATSLPAAMSMPAVWMLLSMTSMALGLAFPYIVLGIFPPLVSKLPRPGSWMESLKQALSFFLFAAAAWFLTVYFAFIPEDNMPWVLMSLVLYCAAWWVYGRWCPIYRSGTARVTGFICALAIGIAGVYYSMPRTGTPAQTAISTTDEYTVAHGTEPIWNTWSPELMEEALADGHPVYVDFTARWCVTCLANKKVAYTEEVCRLFQEGNVVLMRADKTKPNPAIDAELRRLNRGSVPTNALYLDGRAPIVTTELLTPDYMVDFLRTNLPGLSRPQPGTSPTNHAK